MNDLSYTDKKRLRDLQRAFEKKEKRVPGAKQSLQDLVLVYSYNEAAALAKSVGITPRGRKIEILAILLRKGLL